MARRSGCRRCREAGRPATQPTSSVRRMHQVRTPRATPRTRGPRDLAPHVATNRSATSPASSPVAPRGRSVDTRRIDDVCWSTAGSAVAYEPSLGGLDRRIRGSRQRDRPVAAAYARVLRTPQATATALRDAGTLTVRAQQVEDLRRNRTHD